MKTTTTSAPSALRLPRVATEQFEFSHGRTPRGFGSWAFSVAAKPQMADVFFTRAMTYAEAKKVAQHHFAGQYVIHAQP